MRFYYPALQAKASPRLETLPFDTWIQIQKHLEARDIIALRKSCKGLHAITRQRIVWLNALRRMCRRHGVFAPSFPLGDMSITELEHASLCPSRLSSLIHDKIPLRSFVTRILEPRTPCVDEDSDEDANLDCSGAFLIPGGRFLVVNSESHGMCLWDLGIHAGKVPKFKPVAVIPEVDLKSLCTGPTQDSLGIVIISISNRVLRAHEIYPCTSNPQFTLVGSVKYAQKTSYVDRRPALSGDLLAFDAMPDCIVVWNVRRGEAIGWKHSESIFDILISGDSVVLVQESKLSVWDIPPLQPLLEGSYEIIDHAPKYEIIHPFPYSEGSSASSVVGHWFSSIDPLISLGLFGNQNRESVMVCYAVKSINPYRDPTLPMVLPIKMGTVLNLPAEARDGTTDINLSGSLQYCEDELCHISLSEDTMIISLVTPPTSLNGPSSSITTDLLSIRLNPRSCSFCAVSGRLVVVEEEGDIRIMDFLIPPP